MQPFLPTLYGSLLPTTLASLRATFRHLEQLGGGRILFEFEVDGWQARASPAIWGSSGTGNFASFFCRAFDQPAAFERERVKRSCEAERLRFIIGTSLDGADAQTHEWIRWVKGGFEKTLRAMCLLKEAKVPFIVQCSLNQRNKTKIFEIARLCHEHGARTVYP